MPILDSEYTDKVVLKLLVPDDQVEEVKKAITEGTNGRAGLEKDAELYFAKVNGEVKTFESKRKENVSIKIPREEADDLCYSLLFAGLFYFRKLFLLAFLRFRIIHTKGSTVTVFIT